MMIKKKKIAILTRHDVPNYGSFLQTLATQEIIEEMGLEPTIIDYKREDDSTEALIKQYCEDHNSFFHCIYYNTLWRLSHYYIDRVMMKTRQKYLKCSKPVDKTNIKTILKEFDIYLTGSDQVWNAVGSGRTKEIDNVYFWNELPMGSKILSYAASFGDSKLSNEDYQKCKEGLSKFKYISIREDSGLSLLRRMGYEAEQVIDPTMLVDKQFWVNIAVKSNIRPKKKYALIYNLHSDSNMKDYICEDLQKNRLDVYSITTTFRKGIGKNYFCPSIQDFLYLFMNASCIYADSFHAIAFSIIFNIPIVVTLPMQYSTRLESILRLFNLEDCIVEKKKKNSLDKTRINWEYVNKKLDEERRFSKAWLETVIENLIRD